MKVPNVNRRKPPKVSSAPMTYWHRALLRLVCFLIGVVLVSFGAATFSPAEAELPSKRYQSTFKYFQSAIEREEPVFLPIRSFHVAFQKKTYMVLCIAPFLDVEWSTRWYSSIVFIMKRSNDYWHEVYKITDGDPLPTGEAYTVFDDCGNEIAKVVPLEMDYSDAHVPWSQGMDAVVITRSEVTSLEQILDELGIAERMNLHTVGIGEFNGGPGPEMELLDLKFYGEGDDLDYPRTIRILRFEKGRLVDVSPKFEERIFDYIDSKFPYSMEWIQDPNKEKGPAALNYVASRLLAYGAVEKWDEGLEEFTNCVSAEGWFNREWVMERAEYLKQRFIAEGRDHPLDINFDLREYRPPQDSTGMPEEDPET